MMEFADKMVSYDRFLDDLAERVVEKMRLGSEQEVMSQRQAYERFGRANVDRWRRQHKLTIRKRPGKVEYLTTELRRCQRVEQDYLLA